MIVMNCFLNYLKTPQVDNVDKSAPETSAATVSEIQNETDLVELVSDGNNEAVETVTSTTTDVAETTTDVAEASPPLVGSGSEELFAESDQDDVATTDTDTEKKSREAPKKLQSQASRGLRKSTRRK